MGTYKGFSQVSMKKPERSKFDLSHEKKLSTRMGRLTPVFISETLPNDTFRVNTEVMIRLAPMLAPIYHRVNVFVHFFFVPNRLLYEDWEEFITNGQFINGEASIPVIPPYASIGQILGVGIDLLDEGSLADYLGVRPIPDADAAAYVGRVINMLPFAAAYKVWYDYYRDRNFEEDKEVLPLPSGEQNVTAGDPVRLFFLYTRCWQHDYFTSALPFTQRGADVLLPVDFSGYAPIVGRANDGSIDAWDVDATLDPGAGAVELHLNADPNAPAGVAGVNDFGYANLNDVQDQGLATSINDLRQAVRLQEWFERNAVAGNRYTESIMAHFARRTSDGRLQRAEYLGGGRVPVQISEVMTTAFSADGDSNIIPPATMTGRGATYANKNSFKYNCEEHGFIIGFMSVMPTSAYMQGIPRMFQSRFTFLDYPWPSFAHLGEQEVYDYEIWAENGTLIVEEEGGFSEPSIFGYQSRYADWKWIPSTAHGDFRSTLDYWHLDRKFEGLPTLDGNFTKFEDALQDRIFAVSESDTLWCYIHNNVSVVRSLPYFGTPRL